MASLTLGGQTLLTPDGGGLLRQFTDCYISLADLRLFGCDSIVRHTQRQDIGYPNYSTPHEFRLNTFYHYSGCSRWSFGLFVVDDATVEEIVTGEQALVLNTDEDGFDSSLFSENISDFGAPDADNKFSINVNPLAARRLTHSNVNDVWLLPVVDERYFWQNENIRITTADTWAQVYAGLGITLDEAVHADYLLPNKHRIEGIDHNKGTLADAVLWSTGQWYEPRFGKAFAWSTAAALNVAQSKLFVEPRADAPAEGGDTLGVVVAGGVNEFTGTPEVTVRFPGYEPCHDPRDVDVYSVSVDEGETAAGGALEGETATAAGGTEQKIFYSTALADFSAGNPTPANSTDLDALAAKIGADYKLASQTVFDITFAGVRSWYLANTDVAIYEFGADKATGKLSCQTRVQSLPYNFGVDFLLHEHADVNEEIASTCKQLLGKTDATHNKGASGVVSIYSGDTKGSETDTGRNVTAWNRFANVGSGKWVIVACVDGGYELVAAEC